MTAAVIRDAFYIDGGYLWWLPGLADGTYGPSTTDGINLNHVWEDSMKLTVTF